MAVTSLCALAARLPTGLAIAGAIAYASNHFNQLRTRPPDFQFLFIVPLMAMVAVWVSTGHTVFRFTSNAANPSGAWIRRDGLISLLICILIGAGQPLLRLFWGCDADGRRVAGLAAARRSTLSADGGRSNWRCNRVIGGCAAAELSLFPPTWPHQGGRAFSGGILDLRAYFDSASSSRHQPQDSRPGGLEEQIQWQRITRE